MEGRHRLRRLALALRAVGLALIVVSLSAALLRSGAGSALAQVMPVPGLGTPVPEGTPTPAATPTPTPPPATPAPSPTPTPQPHIVRGGPLTFTLSGNLTMGEHSFSSTRGDSNAAGGTVTTGQSQATNNAGLMLQLERRTGTTTLTMGVPFGVSATNRSTFGQLQGGYYTPHFGIQYMPQSVSALGGIPVGSTLAGFSLVVPLKGGDLSIYQGNALVGLNNGAHVYGLRARSLLGHNLLEFGLLRASREDGGGTIDTLLGGFASDNGNLNQLFEGALQKSHAPTGGSSANAYQYRLDYGSDTVYSTLTLKHISQGFTSIGNGTINADDQISAGFRTQSVDIQETLDREGNTGAQTLSRQGTFSYFTQFGKRHPVSTMWTLSDQRSTNSNGVAWLGSAGMQFTASLRDISALFQVQGTRSTSSGGGSPLGGMTYQAMLQKPFGSYLAQVQYQLAKQTSLDSFSRQGVLNASVSRQWGLTSLTLSDTLTHTQTFTSDAFQTAPILTLARQLSPSLSLGVSYGIQTTRDALNPASNGRSRIFNVQLTAPFAIGNGIVQGRSDPRLPATISGMVINDIGNQGPFTSTVSNAAGNIMVVLDGSQVQRTDLSGRFQFNFVTPGRHTVQIDLSSLPRGVTPDQPIASVDVLGGQQGQVFFRIGNYGGVQGHVFGRDQQGQLVPIAGVVLMLDSSGGISTTGPDGSYAFGHLNAGTHLVAVQNASLPAMVSLPASSLSQKIVIRNGEIAKLDFTASPLGSISGFVVYDPSLAPDFKGGVMNAYVVAEPGDFAAITNPDGSFLLDNIPQGTYTLDLDPETVPPDTANSSGSQSVTVNSSNNVEGVRFVVGRKAKSVVFTLKTTESSEATMTLREGALPPGGATEVAVDAGERAKSVVVTAFDKKLGLTYDKSRKRWVGTILVPLSAELGTVSIVADVNGPDKASASADLKVDPGLPIATFVTNPRRPMRGQYVTVQARFLADVHPGDSIRWLDGQLTKLSQPITGRVYQFTVKISVQPMRGMLLTRQGSLPITLR